MSDLERVVEALKDRRLPVVAKRTDIHINTLRAIARGSVTNPHRRTVRDLSRYLFGEDVKDG